MARRCPTSARSNQSPGFSPFAAQIIAAHAPSPSVYLLRSHIPCWRSCSAILLAGLLLFGIDQPGTADDLLLEPRTALGAERSRPSLTTVAGSETSSPSSAPLQTAQRSDNETTRFPWPGLPSYWVVSSRRTVQHRLHRGEIQFDVFASDDQGQLAPSDGAGLRAGLVPGIPVCIFVHGSFVEWWSTSQENVRTARWLRDAAPDRPVQLIFYTWPSDGPYVAGTPLPLDLAVRGMQAEFNALHLGQMLHMIPQECPVCYVGHSHGARAVAATLHLLSGGPIQGYALQGVVPRRCRAVFIAGAFDHDWLNPGQRYGRALCFPESVLNLRNRDDFPLSFYQCHRPFSGASIATTGFTPWDRYYQGELTVKAHEVDVTRVVGAGHVWPYYLQSPEIAALLSAYAQFTD